MDPLASVCPGSGHSTQLLHGFLKLNAGPRDSTVSSLLTEPSLSPETQPLTSISHSDRPPSVVVHLQHSALLTQLCTLARHWLCHPCHVRILPLSWVDGEGLAESSHCLHLEGSICFSFSLAFPGGSLVPSPPWLTTSPMIPMFRRGQKEARNWHTRGQSCETL